MVHEAKRLAKQEGIGLKILTSNASKIANSSCTNIK